MPLRSYIPLSHILFGGLIVLSSVLSTAPARALELVAVDIKGLDNPAQLNNVRAYLSLERLDDTRRKNLREGRLAYLLRQAPAEAQRALEPFGYYDSQIEVDQSRDNDQVTVTLTITRGDPIRVLRRTLTMTGDGEDDPYLSRALERFRPKEGEIMDHRRYEASKSRVAQTLSNRGYFDAEPTTPRITVTRASNSAEIDLHWDSGVRYKMGEARFGEHYFRPGLFEQLVDWKPGEAYQQANLLRLQDSLTQLEYFSAVDVHPEAEQADEAQRVPIAVELALAKRTAYTAGVSYGTNSGGGVRAEMQRRYVNTRGHKFSAEVDLAQYRRRIGASYRIPAFDWLDGWYGLSTQLREEDALTNTDTPAIPFSTFEIIGRRSGQLGPWNLTAALHLQRERFKIFGNEHYASLVYPALRAQYSNADDPLYPRRGLRFDAEFKTGLEALASELNFTQLRVGVSWVRGIGERQRVLLRGEIGTTAASSFDDMPPSLRFYAGGDRSVRGYAYRELGPRATDPETGDQLVIGGKHLLVASAEFEHMFTEQWGAAIFVDVGNAFNDSDDFENRVGVGLGVRWHSPIGPVRVDIGHGLDNPDSNFQLHINIGTDL